MLYPTLVMRPAQGSAGQSVPDTDTMQLLRAPCEQGDSKGCGGSLEPGQVSETTALVAPYTPLQPLHPTLRSFREGKARASRERRIRRKKGRRSIITRTQL